MAPFAASPMVERIEQHSLRVQQPPSSSELVSLAMGEPDFATPVQITQAAADALTGGYTHYGSNQGDAELREALAEAIKVSTGHGYSPSQLLITHGGSGGLAAAILATVAPGDTVVLPDPTYSLYADLVHMAGGTVEPCPVGADLHWDLEALRELLPTARMFAFCNPCNPTGIVHTRAELAALAEMLEGTDCLVVADEAYSELVYTDEPFASALALPALADRTIYVQTFSKSYAMTGWRLGYVAGPAELIPAVQRIHNTFNGSLNPALQRAALAAVRTGAADVTRMWESYRVRRELMLSELAGVEGLTVTRPDGAFYVFPRYDVELPAVELVPVLRENGVAVRPGSEFGSAGEGHLRLSYAASPESIVTGIARLSRCLSTLKRGPE